MFSHHSVSTSSTSLTNSGIQDIPLPSGATMAKRTGQHLCIADHDNYNMIDLNAGLLFPLLPALNGIDANVADSSWRVERHHLIQCEFN